MGWSGSVFTKHAKYYEGCLKLNYVHTYRIIITGFALKILAHSLAWGRSEPFQGSLAYLGPHGVTPRVIANFLGAWEARKKRGGFLILFCIQQSK